MKFNSIAAACLALCSASAFSAVLNPVSDVPDLTFYIGGASAQATGVSVVVPADMFAVPADVIKITQAAGQKATGWYGMSKASLTGGTSKKLFVVYNSTNGSAAGVAQLLSPTKTEAEATVVTVGNAGCGPVTGIAPALTAACSTAAATEVDMALADVNPSELVTGVLAPGANGNLSFSNLNVQKTALQGFGVVVNPALYPALQVAQGLTGCAGNVTSAACQPSISRSDYASLVTAEGAVKTAAQLLRNSDATPLTLVRRTDSSGTQAASSIFFANNVCGTVGFAGALTPVHDFDSNPGVFDITEQTGTGAVKTALTGTATTGYGLGVISLENVTSTSPSSWQYVKLDGVSPNFSAAGAADALNRNAFASGAYPFAFEMSAMYRNSAPATTVALATAVINGLKDSTKHNLVGIAYLDGLTYVAGGKQAYVNRGGNNCQPLIN